MEAKQAYKKGWDASKRTKTFDLDAAEERFIDRHGWDLADDFVRGWVDFASDRDYMPVLPNDGEVAICDCGQPIEFDGYHLSWIHRERGCGTPKPTAKGKLPKELTKSEAWYDDEKEALKLWCDGFRPMRALDLKPMMLVAYHETDVFQMGPVGSVRFTLIGDVMYEEDCGQVVCSTSDRGNVETDEGAEVWAKDGRI